MIHRPRVFVLVPVAARLRHMSATKWGTRKYMNIELLKERDIKLLYSAALMGTGTSASSEGRKDHLLYRKLLNFLVTTCVLLSHKPIYWWLRRNMEIASLLNRQGWMNSLHAIGSVSPKIQFLGLCTRPGKPARSRN